MYGVLALGDSLSTTQNNNQVRIGGNGIGEIWRRHAGWVGGGVDGGMLHFCFNSYSYSMMLLGIVVDSLLSQAFL